MKENIPRTPFPDASSPKLGRSVELLRWRGTCDQPSSSLIVIDRAPKRADVCLIYVAGVSTGTSTCNDSAYLATAVYEEVLEARYGPRHIRFFGFDVDTKHQVRHFYEIKLRWGRNGFVHRPDSLGHTTYEIPRAVSEASLGGECADRERKLETPRTLHSRGAVYSALWWWGRRLGSLRGNRTDCDG